MNAINDTKVEEFLKALSTAKQSLNRSEQILGAKSDRNVLTDTEDVISNSPNSTTLDGLLKYDTPTHSYATSTSIGSYHGDFGMLGMRSPFDTYNSVPLDGADLSGRRPLFESVNGGTAEETTVRHRSEMSNYSEATQLGTDGDRVREDSLERRLGALREENSRLVNQSLRGQGVVDDLKLKLRMGTNKLEQTQSDLAGEHKQRTLLEDRVAGMEGRMRAIQQDSESQRSRVSELEEQLAERERHMARLAEELSSRSEELKNLKRSYETVSRTLEQTVSSQAKLRDALTHCKEREREMGLLSEERLTQLQSAESKLFESQQHLESAKNQKIIEIRSSPSNGLAAENVSLKEKVSVLSKQASRFQLELSTARSQLQLMESLAVRLESPSPRIGTESKFSSSSNNRDDRLKFELDNKGRQIRLLENQLTDKTRSSADHVTQLQQFQKQINNLRKEKEQCKEEFDEKFHSELNKLKLTHSDHSRELETQLEGCSGKLKLSKREVDTLRHQLTETKRQEVALTTQNETLSSQNATLNHKLELTKIGRSQELEALQREAEQGGQTVRDLEVALKKCRDELERQANQLMASEQEKRERISNLELELKLSKQDLHQVMEAANKRNKDLQVQISSCSELENKMTFLQSEWDEKLQLKEVLVSDLQSKVAESGALLSELRGELEHHQRVSREQSREVAELRTHLATCQGENRALEQQAKLIEQVRMELKQSRDRESELSSQLSAAKERVGELSGAQNQLTASLANEERLCAEVKAAKQELECHKQELRDWRSRSEGIQKSLENRSRELEKKGEQILELDQAFHKLKTDAGVRGSEQDRAILQGQGELRAMKERVAELSSEVSALRRHNSSIEEEKRRMEEQLVRHKNATLESQDKHTQALQALQHSRRETQDCSQQLKSVKDTLKAKETQLDNLKRQLDTTSHRVTELDKKYDQSNRSAELSQQKVQCIQEESRNTIGRLETESERLKQQLELTTKQGFMQTQRIQEIHAQGMGRHEQEMTSLRLELRQKQEKYVSESRELARLEASHATLSADLTAEKECSLRLRQTLSLKESEVARITARLSSLERQLTMHTMRQEPLSISRASSRSSIDPRDHLPLEMPYLPSLTTTTLLPDTIVSHHSRSRSSTYNPPPTLRYDNWAPSDNHATPKHTNDSFSSSMPSANFPSRQEMAEGVNLSLTQLAEDLARAVSHPQPLPYLSPSNRKVDTSTISFNSK